MFCIMVTLIEKRSWLFCFSVHCRLCSLCLGLFALPLGVIDIPCFCDCGSLSKPSKLQSTFVISKSKGLSDILRDIRTSTYQICRIEEKISRTTAFYKWNVICNILKILSKKMRNCSSVLSLVYFGVQKIEQDVRIVAFLKMGICQRFSLIVLHTTLKYDNTLIKKGKLVCVLSWFHQKYKRI